MLSSAPLTAFVATSDPDRARNFYAGTLGLELAEETPFALVFRLPGATLRVTTTERVTAAPYTVVGWTVDALDETIASLRAGGVDFLRYKTLEQDEAGAWRSPSGVRIAWFQDPDANVLSLSEAS